VRGDYRRRGQRFSRGSKFRCGGLFGGSLRFFRRSLFQSFCFHMNMCIFCDVLLNRALFGLVAKLFLRLDLKGERCERVAIIRMTPAFGETF
jgi:hypothetical protein